MKRKLSVLILLVLLAALLVLPAQGQEQLDYVTDGAGLLTNEERTALEQLCSSVSTQYDCGIYIMTVDDYTDHGSGDVFEVTYSLYHDYGLGKGDGSDGLLLLLSMAERDFALFVYGEQAQYAFDTYGQEMLEWEFLTFLEENDWYGGFHTYATVCAEYLELAAQGTPVRESKFFTVLVVAVISFILSLIVCLILRMGMKNVRVKSEASSYTVGNLKLEKKVDRFTHKTHSRVKIESKSGSSTVRSGGGGSGRSGKF